MVRLIRKLNSERRSVIAISRDLHDVVLEVANRIVVLRLGRKVAEFNREEVNASDLVAAITGIRSRLAAA
jgi:D-xylose transport system ATP-binding protein